MPFKEKIKVFLFENQTIRQTVLKNTFWLSAGTMTSRLIRAVVIIYAARILGTAGYGIFSYAMSFAAFFSVFSDIGLGGLLTREAVKKPEKLSAYISTTLGLKVVLLALTLIALLFLSPFIIKISEAKLLLPYVAMLMVFDSLRTYGFSITRAQNKMELEAGLTVATEIFISLLSFSVLFIKPTAGGLSLAYALGSGLGFLLVFYALRKELGILLTHFDRSLVKPLIYSAWPFAIMGILSGFLINIDNIILGLYRNASELGLYAAAQRPINLFYILPSLVSASLFSIVNHLHRNNDHERIKTVLEKSMSSVLGVAMPLTVGGIILGRPIMILLFGAPYAGATLTFQLLLLTMLLVFPGTILGNVIFSYDKQKVFIISAGLGAVANVIFDLLLIPPYGIAGSAVATIIAQIFVNGVNWRTMYRLNQFKISPYLKNIFAATVLTGLCAWFLQTLGVHVLINVILSALLYLGFLIWRKEPLLKMVRIS